ncbi:MAG: hypothetical protein B7X28_00200 [Halothiobacillus sp. 13-55-253]|jgi:uncharacterized protein YutE (UPF0331/DUF86 family)|nr:MAG: hypothetical protein B7X28_00200 [Halothiobacillus sp. 13-55-253]
MRLDLYQAETERIASEQTAILDEALAILLSARNLSALENNGVLHALQMLIENAIGKAKQWLKAQGQPVPISAYDAFAALVTINLLDTADLPHWNALIGIRNRIVHDYMNIRMERIHQLILDEDYRFITRFLMRQYELDEHQYP